MSTEHEPEDVTTPAGAHLALLIKRQWPQIAEILEEEGEVKITASIHITDRAPEEGNHADKDSRVKTTIAFSRKFSDSTESELPDPRQPALDFGDTTEAEDRNCPACGTMMATGQTLYECDICGRECCSACSHNAAGGKLICDHCDTDSGESANGTAPVDEAAEQPEEDGGDRAEQPEEKAPWEEQHPADVAATVDAHGHHDSEILESEPATRTEMEGIVMSESPEPMVLTLADRLHAAAAGVPTPRVKVSFAPGFPPSKYRGLFRRAAKKQGWPEACIDLLDKVAEGAVLAAKEDGPVAEGLRVLEVFSAHTEPEEKKPRKPKGEATAEKEAWTPADALAAIPFLVNPMTMDEPSRFMREFRRAASAAGWAEQHITAFMDTLRGCDTVTEMYEHIRQHIAEQKSEEAPEAPAGAEFAGLPV